MTPDEFNFLCRSCDDLLKKGKCKVNRIAISWLHVLRGHPELLKEYTHLFSRGTPTGALRDLFSACWKIAHGFLYSCKATSFFSSHIIAGKVHQKVDVFIFSHIVNENQAGRSEDFYFGSIPDLINSSDCRAIVLLLNHSLVPAKKLAKKMPAGIQVPRIFLSQRISPKRSITIYFSMLCQCLQLFVQLLKKQNFIERRIIASAATESLSAGTFANMRLYFHVKALVEKYQPNTIFFTFEGHAYERMIMAAARSLDNAVQCIGYQHAAVFNNQHAMIRRIGSSFDPDMIYTTGHAPLQILRTISSYKKTELKVAGTDRAFRSMSASTLSSNIISSCLVVPEAFLGECYRLFSYSLFCARHFPEIQFTWRLHPHTNKHQLLVAFPEFRELPDNVHISNATLEVDIAKNQAVLYRGSTVVINAVVRGLYPIYLSQGDSELIIDPLYQCTEGKEKVTPDVLPSVFTNRSVLSDDAFATIISYAKTYYEPIYKELFLRVT